MYIYLFHKYMGKHTQSVDNAVVSRIYGKGMGWVFTPADFQDLGSRTAVGLALMRHKRSGIIRQLARGLYDYPATDPLFGFLSPSTDTIAKALRGRDASRLQPTGAYAANILGLSDQVPMKTIFLTDGRSCRVVMGKREIILKHTTLRNMATAGTISGLVIQALRWIGHRHVDDVVIAKLQTRLSDKDKNRLLKDIRFAPAWIAEIIRTLTKPGKTKR